MDNLKQLIILQEQLENYKLIIQALKKEPLTDYTTVIYEGIKPCETMLELLLQQKGYVIQNGLVFVESAPNVSVFEFCCASLSFIPEEYRSFIELINTCREWITSIGNTSHEIMLEFAEAFDNFTHWFLTEFFNNSPHSEYKNEKVMNRFFSIKEEWEKEQELSNNSDILSQMAVLTAAITSAIAPLKEKMDEIHVDLKEGFSQIDAALRKLSDQVSLYQSLVERQLSIANSEEEKEHIISAYTEEYSKQVMEKTRASTSKNEYEQEKQKLICSLGLNAWNKMAPDSQTFLITAKVMFRHLRLFDDIIDYSGVCVLVAKALEVEMDRRFYSDFVTYLKEKFEDDFSMYHTALLESGQLRRPDKFTMGSLAYVLCYSLSKTDSQRQKMNNYSQLVDYTKTKLMSSSEVADIKKELNRFAENIEIIRETYRNPSAHTNKLKKTDAEECFKFVIDSEKVLKTILEAFDY